MHSDRELLFQGIGFSVEAGQKVALVGNNGAGKSTLLKIIGGLLSPASGEVLLSDTPYYVPQHFGQYDDLTVAEALKVADKINALNSISAGNVSPENFDVLNDDWGIEERVLSAFSFWKIAYIDLARKMHELSGGEKTKVFLAGIHVHQPSAILLDEPSNHLDREGREQLYDLIRTSKASIITVSHDRILLNMLPGTYELSRFGIEFFGGNYEFYKARKESAIGALHSRLDEKEKELKKARKTAKEVAERRLRQVSRDEKTQGDKGLPRILINNLKNKAAVSTAKLKDIHADKLNTISEDLKSMRQKLPENKELKLNFENTGLHVGKILVTAENVNFGYGSDLLWDVPVNFVIRSGDRLVIAGNNGIGKTTLLKLITGLLMPNCGVIIRADFNYLYVDQEYSLIDNRITVSEQAHRFNQRSLPDHEVNTILHRFLFPVDSWDKTCEKLSGGEKMRLMFCCLMISNNIPDMFILDEPTNNLDIRSMEIITETIKEYRGTILLISHDRYFIHEIGADKCIQLGPNLNVSP